MRKKNEGRTATFDSKISKRPEKSKYLSRMGQSQENNFIKKKELKFKSTDQSIGTKFSKSEMKNNDTRKHINETVRHQAINQNRIMGCTYGKEGFVNFCDLLFSQVPYKRKV